MSDEVRRTTLPYLGIQFGGYFSQLDVGRQYTGYSASLSFSKHLFLFSPGVGLHGGLLFQLSDKVWMDLKVRPIMSPESTMHMSTTNIPKVTSVSTKC